MSDPTNALVPLEEREVDFYGDRIVAVEVIGESGEPDIYIPVRPLCEFLGLNWSAQFRRIQRDPVLVAQARSVAVTATEAGGHRDMLCLPLEFLHGWLFGVSATRVKPAFREAVIRYQREVYRVLWRAFNPPATAELEARVTTTEGRLDLAAQVVGDIRRRLTAVEERVLPGQPITEEMAAELSLQVRALGQLLRTESEGTLRNTYQAVWAELYRRFGIASYRNLPATRYIEALSFLEDWRRALHAGDDKPATP